MLRALRAESPEQVDSLVLRKTYTIVAVDTSSDQVMLDDVPDERDTSMWNLAETCVQVQVVVGPTCIQSSVLVCEGDELEQVHTFSSVEDLHQEFSQFWRSRWQKHSSVSLSDWGRVIKFASAFLPAFRFQFDDVSPGLWYTAVKRFKPRAARGPDGFAKADLQFTPEPLMLELLALLHVVERGEATWPEQWLEGHVISLAKMNERSDVNAIGQLSCSRVSIIFRTCSGIRARQALTQLSAQLRCEANGFMPGREALEFWLGLQAEIELSCALSDSAGRDQH